MLAALPGAVVAAPAVAVAGQGKAGEAFALELTEYRAAAGAYCELCRTGEKRLDEAAFDAALEEESTRLWKSGARLTNLATDDPAHAMTLLRLAHDGLFNDAAMTYDVPLEPVIVGADDEWHDRDLLDRAMVEAAMRIIERYVGARSSAVHGAPRSRGHGDTYSEQSRVVGS
jgi:hypothetical protein